VATAERSGGIIEPQIMEGSYFLTIDKDGWTVRSADGRDSCQVEETVLVTRKGFEILTV